ncbi:filamentous hemagglutinin N-terminal domain-containing protein [Methyloversatilis sp. XJ19-13]|uniref:filamentous hemagglutinin N-terminal domain-containing protein n=1 Tax=Methyloversatilis sp. XJ19-13 TaxID=2963430 RepID=UPI00211D04FC|nr:filamentous hemagglutinin N-terminal domain-containing protein [Methyloversatilis sp. XJ19-13]MCQ9374374.1 filamentous hemagglutinin N-terminal domain-containing protein [Methyloversatilis sp. XJ19-13]
MNKGRYRLVFSEEKGGYVPVPEETKACGKGGGARALRRVVAAMAAALPGLAIANPTGHQVVHGNVGVQVQGSTLNITASDKAIINWQQFSIQPGETTRFIQPGSTASVLNRVVGQDPSRILGNLIANGRVFLINPNGVLFGAGAKVDTAGLVASTLNIRNEDFLAGRMKFDADGNAGKLRNDGTLKTTGGPLILIATDVENTGLITAENGDIVLAAGKSVEIADPHQPSLRVRVEAGGEAINLGQLIARGGSVGMFGAALTQAGKISATGAHRTEDGRIVLRGSKSVTLTAQSETVAQTADGAGGAIDISAPEVKVDAGALVDASGTAGGRIEVSAEQRATVEGTLRAVGRVDSGPAAGTPAPVATNAPSPAVGGDLDLPVTAAGPAPVAPVSAPLGRGGDIVVTAETVVLDGDAVLDASGDTGGGSILVGGDWQGANAEVRNARISWVGHGVSLLSDALLNGDGGKVVVWADEATAFAGSIWARGGREGGDGGQVEVSGKMALLYRGRTDTRAERGRNGELLLDPLAIIIQGGTGDGSTDGSQLFRSGVTPGTITADSLGPTLLFESEIEEQSKTTDIILRAQRSVTVGSSAFSYTGSGNLAGEVAGTLVLADGSNLLIETRNLGGEEGGPSAGIDLVTGGLHDVNLRIITQGTGSITMQTGYSNGTAVGDQRADIIVPVLTAGDGSILLRTVRGTGSTIQFRNAVTTDGVLQTSADMHVGGQRLQGGDGVAIDGDYTLDNGTLDIDGASAAISGTLYLSGTLDGSAPLTLGGLVWYSGVMTGTGAVTLTGAGELPPNFNYRYLDRTLNIAGTLDLKNNLQLYIRNGGTLHLTSAGVLQSTTHDGNIYFNSGASGTALFSADAGAQVNVAAGRQLSLYSDNNVGNQISASFTTSGAGTLALTGGRFTLTGNSVITGSGILAMAGADLFGSGNLTLGNNFRWLNGGMYGDGVTRITGLAQLPQATGNRFLQRRLEVAGTLDANNNNLLYVQNGGVLHITSTGTLRSVTHDGNIYLQAGGSGSAAFSADQGARIDVGEARSLYLFSDNNIGNTFSADVDLTGAGTFAFSGGLITLSGESSIGGTGLFAMNGANVAGTGNLDIDSRFVWTSGSMGGSGVTRIGGLASLPQSNANKFLQRRLEVSGTLDADNNNLLYVQAGGTLHLTSTGRLRSTTNDGNLYLQAGTTGTSRFTAAAGAEIDIAAERTLNLSSDNNLGNEMSVDVDLTGTGTFALTSGNITLTGDSAIGGDGLLALRGASVSGSGNLDIDSRFVWTGGGMYGAGTTHISGDASMPQVTANKVLQRRLEISGIFEADNNYWLYVQNGGSLHLTSTATLRSTTNDGHFYFDAGASGVTLFSADAGATVNVADGLTLRLFSDNNLGNQFSARLNVTGAGTFAMTSGRFTLEGDSVIGGTGTYNLSNTDLVGSGNLTLRDNFNWLSGNMGGTGRTVLDTSVTLSGTRTIDRELVIAEGRTLLLNDNGVLRGSSSTTGGGRLTALGTLAKGEGSGNAYLQYLDISGNIQSRGGLLRLHGYSDGQGASIGGMVASSLNGGGVLMESSTFNIAGQPLEIAADSTLQMSAGTIHLDGAQITGAGTFLVSGGTLLVNADSAITSRFTLSGGTLAGAADFTIGNAFDWSGGTMSGDGRTVLAAGTMATIGSASAYKFLHRRLDVAGTLTLSNSTNYDLYIRDGGTLHIASTGTLATSANGYIYLNESSNGTNNGSVVLSADSGGRIAVADGTTLFLTADTAASNHLRGNFALSGPGAVQVHSGLFNIDQATTFSGSGVLRLNGGTLSAGALTAIANLELTGGTLAGASTVTVSQLDWRSGTMAGTGTTILTGNGALTQLNTIKFLQRRLDVAGTLTLSNSTSSDLYIRDGGTLHIASTGTLATSTNGYIYFNEGNNGSNNGVAALTSAAGGRIAVADGTTLFLTADGAASNLISGNFTLAGPGAVQFDSGLLTVDQTSAFTGAGVLRVNGGTLFAGAATGIANLELTGGTLDGAGAFTLNQLDWRSGTMTGTGTTILAGNGALTQLNTIKYLQRRLEVAGTLTLSNSTSSDLYIRDGGTLHLGATGTLATSGNAYLYMNESFNSAGNGLAQLSSAAGGRIVVAEGNTLFISADGSSNNVIGGSFLFAGPGAVQQTGGTITADLATQITGPGLLRLSGGTFAATAATGIANLELSGGALGGTADVTIGNRFTWNTGSLAGSGVVTLAGTSIIASTNAYKDTSREIRVTGNLTVADQNGYALRLNGARLAIASGGSVVLENDARITNATGRIDNAGLLVKRGPTGLTLEMPLTNTGVLRIEEGVLTASAFPVNDGRVTLLNNATLATGNANLLNNGSIDGVGTIEVRTGTDASTLNNTLTNAGLLQPGGSGSAGVLSIQGNLVQTAAGSLEADLLGTSIGQQDRLQVSGSVALGGDLIITPAAGVTLGAQDRYTVLSCSTDGCLTGSFASIDTNGLTATATTFSNALSFATGTISSTWTSASSGFWDVAANWAGGLIPTAGNDVVIDQAGDLTVTVRTATSGPFTVNSLFSNENISVISGALTLTDDSVINGLLSVSGGTLNIGAQLDLNRLSLSGGTVTGGVLNLLGARSGIAGGNLNNVAVAIGGAGLEVTGGIMNNVTLGKLASVTGNSLVTISNGGILEARGTLTLDGATIRLASTGNWTYLRGNTSAGLTTLNIAGNGTIDFAGSAIYNSFTAWHGNSTLNIGTGINLTGTQSADIFMGTGGTFSGTAIAAATGKTFEFSGSNWNNAGTLRAAGGIVSLTSSNNTTWASSGTLDLDSGSLNLGGTFNTASFNSLDRDGVAAGALSITGALNNTNATLLLDDSTGVVLLSGSITGGTIRANNPAGGALVMNGVGYLIDTTLAGVEGVDGSGLYVIDNGQSMEARGTFNALTSVWSNGLTLDGATIRLASTGNWTYLRGNTSAGLTTLNIAGNGTIDFAGSAIYNSFTAWHGNSTLNIGTGINLTGTQSADIFMGTGGTFSGTAVAGTPGKTMAFTSNAGWTNAGTLRLEGGAITSSTSFTSSGVIRGFGSLNLGANTLTNNGVLRPDGLLTLTGNLVLGAASTLEVGIAGSERGTQYDALDVTGTVTFGGTLRATHEGGYTPGANTGFRLVRYNARIAGREFAALDVPAGFGYGSYYGAANYVLGNGSALTGINEWISNVDGNWSVGSNWSLGAAPNSATQTVLIDRVGVTPTVTISTGTWTIGSLSSEESLTISGGSLTVNGATRIGRTLTINGGRFEALGTLDLNGVSVSAAASQFIANGGGTIADFDQGNGTSTFNAGGLAFAVLTPRGGTVNFNAAVTLPSSTLRVANYVANINADLGLATLDIDSGTVNLNVASSAASIDLSGGTLNVAGNTAMSGNLTWSGGTIAGGGVLSLAGVLDQSSNTTVYLRQTTLVHSNSSGNSRIANTSGSGFNLENGALLRNTGSLTLSVEAPNGILYIDQDTGPLGGRFENTGTLTKVGAGRADIGNFGAMTFLQGGTLNVEAGSLTLGNTVSLAGTQNISAGAFLQVLGGTTTVAAGGLFNGAGTLAHSGGTLILGDGVRIASTFNLSGSSTLNIASGTRADIDGRFNWSGGTINGGGVLDANGVFDQSGNTTVHIDATTLQHHDTSGESRIANTSASGFNIENGGLFRNTGTLALIIEAPNGNLYIDHDSGAASRFENTGTLTKSGAGNVDFGSFGNVSFDQLGHFVVSEGTASLNNAVLLAGTQQISEGATLQVVGGTTTLVADGRIDGMGQFRLNSGTLALEDNTSINTRFAQSAGTLRIAPGIDALISNRYDWSAGTVSGGNTLANNVLVPGGTLTVSGELQLVGTSNVTLDNATLVHTHTGSGSRVGTNNGRSMLINNGAVFRNAAGSLLTLDTPDSGNTLYIYQSGGTGSRFENFGSLVKSGVGTLDLGYNGTLTVQQSGTLLIDEGTLSNNAVSTFAGTQQISTDALLLLSGSTSTLAAGSSFSGDGRVQQSSGTTTLGDGASITTDVLLSGGTLNVATGASVIVDGDLQWTAGTLGGAGTLTLNGVLTQVSANTVTLNATQLIHTNASGNSRIGNNNGRSILLNNGALLQNAAGALLTLETGNNNNTLYIYQSTGTGSRFDNLGTLTKTGAGTLDLGYNGGLQFDQRSVLNVQQGLLSLNGVTVLSGAQQLAAGGTLDIRGATTTLAATGSMTGAGNLSLSGGTLSLADGAAIASTLIHSGGTLLGTGANTISGRYDWTAGTIAGDGTLTVSGPLQITGANTQFLDARTLVHTNASGSSRIFKTSGAVSLNNGGVLRNASGARLLFDSGNGNFNVNSSGGGLLVNEGTLTKVGSGSTAITSNIGFNQSGLLTIGQGSLSVASAFTNAGTIDLFASTTFGNTSAATTNTGIVSGFGTLALGTQTFTNRGLVRPGGAGAIGTLNITGRYAQDATGTLQIERGNVGTDALIISSTATLGGTLVVSELPGYISTGGTSDVVTASALSGSFSTVTLPSGYSTQVVGNRQVLSFAGAICGGVCWDGGAGSLLWTDAANWTGDLLPGTNDLVFIDLGTISVELNQGIHTIRSLNTAAGNTLVVSGGSLTVTDVATLAGDLVISGGTANFNGAAQLARLMLSSGVFGGSGTATFTQSGSTWSGGDASGTGRLVFAAGSTFSYAAGTRTIARRLDIEQGGRFSLDSGSLTTTGGASNAGVVNVAFGATARYGGSATYLLDATGQFDGGGRIEFINTAQVTSATTAPPIANNTFTVRVQDSARFTLSTPGAIANLELADSGQVIAQAGLQAGSLTQTGGTLTLNAASGAGTYNWNGGTLAGNSTFSIVGGGSWTRGTLTGNLVIANGASLTLSGTGSDDVQSTSYKRFGAGSLTNFGTLNWLEGHIDVIGAGRVDNHGLIDLASDFSFGDRSTGTGTVTMVNHNSGVISKTAGSGEFAIGTLGIPGGTANYTNFTNNGRINVFSGRLRFNIGYSGAPGGGTFTHNNFIEIGAGSTLEIGGALTYNGDADLGAGGVLRRLGGFTINSGGDIFGNGTIDVGTSGTLTNAGALGTLEYGTLSVTGNFVQTDSGVLDLWIGGTTAGTYDQLAVSGSVTLGGTLVIGEDPAYTRGPLSIALITAGNGISGRFASIETPAAGYATAIDGNAFRISFGSIVCGGICWDGGAGTAFWTDAANWSGDALPGLNDLVFIALEGGSTVVLNSGSHTIANLTSTAGNNLTISAGSLTLTGVSGTNSGLVSSLAGDLTLSGSGTLVTNGRLDATRFTQTGGTFNGAGDLFVSTAFSQTGGSHTGFGRTVLGSAVSFAPGSYTFNRDFDIEGTLTHTSGTLTVAAQRTLTISGELDWTAGSIISGPGTLDVADGANVMINDSVGGGFHTLSGITLNNAGVVNYAVASGNSRELLINDGTVFNNTGRFNFTGDNVISDNSGNGGEFNNAGTLAKTGGAGSSGFANQARFNNLDGGTVDSGTGTLLIQTAGNHAGVFNLAGNNVRFNGSTQTFGDGSVLRGTSNFNGATIRADGDLTIDGTLNWSSGSTVTNAGGTGALNVLTTSTLNINDSVGGGFHTLSGITLNNAGIVNYAVAGGNSRELLINDGTEFNNTGRFNFTGDNVISENSGNGGNFNNSGTLAKTGGTGSSGFANQARLSDQGGSYRGETGTLQLASLGTVSGVMHIAAGATITTASALTNTGAIEGSGTLDVGGGTLTNSGVVRPGGDDQIGRLTVLGNVTQTAAGRIEAEFAGTSTNQFDVLDVRGDTLLDGVLEVQALGSAVPVEGMQLPVVTASGALDAGALQLVAPTGFTTRTLGSSLSLGYTACTTGICWDGGAGSQLWTDAANWTGDVLPGVNDLVFITLAGGSNVVLNAIPTVTVAGLTIGNANSLTLTGGVLNAPTTVQPGGTLNLNGGNLNFGNALLNNGVLNYAGGTMSGNVFTNNGTLNVLSGSAGNLTTTSLNNNGSVIVDSGATFEFGSGGGMIFANNGSVAVESGTLSVLAHDADASGPGADSGAYSVDSGATLRFRDAFRDFGPGSSITGPGDVEFTAFSGGVFNINGGYNVGGETRVSGNTLVNFNSNATFGDLRVAGNIGGNGTLTVTDDLTWTAGSIGGNGRVIVVRGDTVLDGSSLALNGAVLNVGGSGLLDTGTQLALNGGSQLIVSDGASLGLGSNTSVGGTGSLVNRGTLEGTLGGGTSNVAVRLVNDGNVQASAGNLGLTGGIGGGGLFVIGDNATMELGGDLPPDIFNRIGGNGTLSFSPTSAPVINQMFAATGGTPLLFSLRSGAVLSSGPNNGVLDGQQSAWQYTANAGFNGNDSARFTLSLGSGTAQINVIFAVASAPAVTQPEVQVITTTLLPEIFQPPRIALPSAPAFTPPQNVNIASIDALSEIVTASGPSFEQPLREFSASRLQCR